MYETIKNAYMESVVVMKGDYPYFVNAISDGNPEVSKEMLDDIVHAISSKTDIECDVILAPEAMGIPYAAAMTLRTGIPFQILRKKNHNMPGEIEIKYTTGYSSSEMYINNIKPGTRAMIIDDVISTGGTIKAMVNALKENGVVITNVIIVLNKSRDIKSIEEEIGCPIITLLDVGVEDGKPVIYSE